MDWSGFALGWDSRCDGMVDDGIGVECELDNGGDDLEGGVLGSESLL